MKALLYGIIMIILPGIARGQETDTTPQRISQYKYLFIPQTVYPMSMRPRPVTTDFELRIQPDSVVCYLPYFGRAYSADYFSRQSPTDFTSVDFAYEEKKTGERSEITIRPEDTRDIRELRLTYYDESVYADVHIILNRQQAIEYRGRLEVIPLD